MKYGSMFSGIEAASVAWKPPGWECQWVCEIEKFPSAVLAHHYPDVPNLGDVTKVDWDEVRTTRPVDLIVFGSPCQSFSVAGKRLGLDDPRGNLALYALAVVARLRPRWFLFENVPGLLSSGGGRDFGAFLGTVGECGYQCAWRILDAQYFGVAQRRRRLFVVGHLGDWRPAAAVLFEPESLRGDSAPRREAGERPSGSLAARTRGGGGLGTDLDLDGGVIRVWGGQELPAAAMCLNAGAMGRLDAGSETLIPATGGGFDVAHALRADGLLCGSADTLLAFSSKDHGADAGEIAPTLRAGGHTNSHANAGVPPAVAYNITPSNSNKDYNAMASEKSQALTAGGNRPSARGGDLIAAIQVRRLTPAECCRLQGFPDIEKSVIIFVCCSDHQKNAALAEIRCLRSQNSAPHVLGGGSNQYAKCAESHSSASLLGLEWPVAADVLIDFGRREVQILSQGKLLWSASDVGQPSSSPLRIPLEDFVRVSALTMGCLVPVMRSGWGDVTQNSITFAALSVSEMAEFASDADALRKTTRDFMMSTTLPVPQNFQNYDSKLQTWSCCVAAAIASFIQEQMSAGSSFALNIRAKTQYLDIIYRGKAAADGPKYKALGNSFAVPVVRWIGSRIQLVEGMVCATEKG